MPLKAGLKGSLKASVTAEMTAAAVGSGAVSGLATPALVALLEAACIQAIEPELEAGQSSVGTRLEVSHLAPTPVGMEVTAFALLEQVEGRRLVFKVGARDEAGDIASGTHDRFLIELASFEKKIRERGAQRQMS